MLSNLGIFSIVLTLLISFLLVYNSTILFRKNNQILLQKIINLSLLQLFFSILCFILLIYGYVSSDFSLINVFQNSHTSKPLFFKIAGTWGNHEGSLLLWINILVIFSYFFLIKGKNYNINFRLITLIIQNFLIIGFLLFLLITSNPFVPIYPVPSEGLGLNPILQDPALAIHPPLLYVGFVGSSIYFSAAIASLMTNFKGKEFANSIKTWVLISWVFQSLGIIVGSIWAYYELGWGGFWFWDPVENASLMPWFVITALMHSVIVLEKRNTIYSWVIILCLLTFILSVTGTFLVRSGILNSVHTFASDPSRGLYILIYLSIMVVGSFLAFFKYQQKEIYNFSLKSKETFVLVNNWFMLFFLITVILGTLYPIFLEVLIQKKISVGPPFYNILIIPIVIPFLIFMAIGPKISWIKHNSVKIWPIIYLLILATILNFIIIYFFGSYSILTNLIIISAVFLIINTLIDLKNSFAKKGDSSFSRIISHLGFAFLIFFIGINNHFSLEKDFNLKVGDKVKFENYKLDFKDLSIKERKNHKAIIGNFIFLNKMTGVEEKLFPEIRIYDQPKTLTYEASIKTKLSHDVYLTMSNIERSDYYNIKFQKKNFMIWIWLSAFIITIGGFLRLFKKN